MRVRTEWTKDYLETTGPDGRKAYVYTGDRHALTGAARRVYARRVTPLTALTFAFLAAAGLSGAPGSRVLYVALPWAGLCFAAALALFDCARILFLKRALTARDFRSSALRLKKSFVLITALSALASVCEVIFFLLNGLPAGEILTMVLTFFCFACSVLAYRAEKAAVWERMPSAPLKPPV
jgi:hypothetical protein